MLLRPMPFSKDDYKEIIDKEDIKALKILNERLGSFFPFFLQPLRRYTRKQVCNSRKDWQQLPGSTKLYEVSMPSKVFTWTVPTGDNNPNIYLENRVIVKFVTKGARYTETVDTMYYDAEKEYTTYKGHESIIVYFPRTDKTTYPYPIFGKAVRIPIKFDSIVATVGGTVFQETIRKAVKEWILADNLFRRNYKNTEVMPIITSELTTFMNTKLEDYLKIMKTFRMNKDANAIRLCLRRMKREIQTLLDKVKANEQRTADRSKDLS